MIKKILIIFTSACNLGYAQIGVNTTDVISTLTVQGSISTNHREVTQNVYFLQEDDCNVSFNSSSDKDGTFYLPKYENGENAFGRMYNIVNLTENLVLKVKAQGGKSLRLGGLKSYDTSSFSLYPGQHLSIVADKNNDWVVFNYPTYARKHILVTGGSIGDKTTISMGDFSFRLTHEGRGDLYLQVMLHANRTIYMNCSSSWTRLMPSSNNRREYHNVIDTNSLYKDQWKYTHKSPGTKGNPVLSYYDHSTLVSIITMKDTGETYRVTCSTFAQSSDKNVGIIVERLL